MKITMPVENAEEKVVFAVFIFQYHRILGFFWLYFFFIHQIYVFRVTS